MRLETRYRGVPITLDGSSDPGEKTLTSASPEIGTWPPSGASHFEMDSEFEGEPAAGSRYLSIKVRLTGTGATGINVPFRLGFKDAETGEWYASAAFTAIADDLMDDSAWSDFGNVYHPEWCRGCVEGYIYIPSLPADVNFNVVVRWDN
jgi:hypothetical protein